MSMFAKAKEIPVAPKAAKKNAKEEIPVTGLANYAIIDKVVKGFTALQKTLGEGVKDEIVSTFVSMGGQFKKRPDNFRGTDGVASASCEIRKRASTSPLTPEETDLLDKNGVPYEEVTLQEDCYVINAAYFADQAMLEKVSKALEAVKGLPDDFIMRQTAIKKKVVTDESIETVFAKGLAASLLDVVCVPAIKPTYDGTLEEALEAAKKLAGLVK